MDFSFKAAKASKKIHSDIPINCHDLFGNDPAANGDEDLVD